jgi:hypothetical protein
MIGGELPGPILSSAESSSFVTSSEIFSDEDPFFLRFGWRNIAGKKKYPCGVPVKRES